MTADQWTAIFQREAKVDHAEAIKTLFLGMMREMEYHDSIVKPIAIWREVAERTGGVIKVDGFERLLESKGIPVSEAVAEELRIRGNKFERKTP